MSTTDCWKEGTDVYDAGGNCRGRCVRQPYWRAHRSSWSSHAAAALPRTWATPPYDNDDEKRRFYRELVLSAWRLRKEAEDAARKELDLPKRREGSPDDPAMVGRGLPAAATRRAGAASQVELAAVRRRR